MRVASNLLIALVVAAAALGAQSFSFEEIRNDLFAGAAGDQAALRRAMSTAQRILKDNPRNPSAMVIHGWAAVLSSSDPGQSGSAGAGLAERGIAEINQAVALAPNEPFVRIMRGILMQAGSRSAPSPMQAPMLENARSDFQRVFELQRDVLDELGTHRLGELLQALGDVHARLGRTADAERYYAMIQQKLPDTEYARRADEWTRTKQPLPGEKTACVGCHAGGR